MHVVCASAHTCVMHGRTDTPAPAPCRINCSRQATVQPQPSNALATAPEDVAGHRQQAKGPTQPPASWTRPPPPPRQPPGGAGSGGPCSSGCQRAILGAPALQPPCRRAGGTPPLQPLGQNGGTDGHIKVGTFEIAETGEMVFRLCVRGGGGWHSPTTRGRAAGAATRSSKRLG